MHMMPSCREVTQMVSESMDRSLSFRTRLWMWMHLALCRYCKRFRRQLLALGIASRLAPGEDAVVLTDEVKHRMKETLKSRKDLE